MEKEYKVFTMTFYLEDIWPQPMVDCRQTEQESLSVAVKEAELYKTWLEVHYGTKISYGIK